MSENNEKKKNYESTFHSESYEGNALYGTLVQSNFLWA